MSGLFDDYVPNPEAKSTFEKMDEGKYTFKIESIDGEKIMLMNVSTGKTIRQQNWEQTEAQLIKAFGTDKLIGATAELEVKHSKCGQYANIVLPYTLPEPGNYRVRIKEVVEGLTKKHPKRKMATITLELSGSTTTVRHWMVIPNSDDTEDNKNMFNGMINSFMNSFDGVSFSVPVALWTGKVAGAKIGHETSTNDGKTYENAVIKKWLSLDEQRELPAWGGGVAVEPAGPTLDNDETVDDDSIPF